MQGDEMKSRTLIGLAVASTFGWAAAAHAGPDHPAGGSASDVRYPSMMMFENDASAIDSSASAALDDGTYSEYYLVSWTPRTAARSEQDAMGSEAARSDIYVLLDDGASVVPMHDVMGSGPQTFVMADDGASVGAYEVSPPNSDTFLLLEDRAYVVSTYDVILLPGDFTQPGGW
jgi:hypothetical protein